MHRDRSGAAARRVTYLEAQPISDVLNCRTAAETIFPLGFYSDLEICR